MTVQVFTSYTVIDCCRCGALFAVPDQVNDELVETGRAFYCPNGHNQHYTNSLKDQLAKTRARLDQAEAHAQRMQRQRDETDRSLRATKGVVTKQRKKLERVKAGVCPCCNRTFGDLARHMATKHPEFLSPLTPAEPRGPQPAVTKG